MKITSQNEILLQLLTNKQKTFSKMISKTQAEEVQFSGKKKGISAIKN